jgi:hypothetical protein
MRSLGYYMKRNLVILYRSAGIGRILKSRTLRWAGLVDWMEEIRNAHRHLVEKPLGNSRRRKVG